MVGFTEIYFADNFQETNDSVQKVKISTSISCLFSLPSQMISLVLVLGGLIVYVSPACIEIKKGTYTSLSLKMIIGSSTHEGTLRFEGLEQPLSFHIQCSLNRKHDLGPRGNNMVMSLSVSTVQICEYMFCHNLSSTDGDLTAFPLDSYSTSSNFANQSIVRQIYRRQIDI